jgi:hypothetical protein
MPAQAGKESAAMEPNFGRQLSLSLRFAVIPSRPGGLAPAACLLCGSALDIHQPDAVLPDRLLATCEMCQAWHLLECAPDGEPALLILLPDASPFRAALGG